MTVKHLACVKSHSLLNKLTKLKLLLNYSSVQCVCVSKCVKATIAMEQKQNLKPGKTEHFKE